MFYDRFVELCRERGKSPASVTREIGLNNSSSSAWKRGATPKGETLQKLANYFGVSVDYLLGVSYEMFPTSPRRMDKMNACRMCDSAYTNSELSSDNDLAYFTIGECDKGYRMMFRSGDGKPTEILLEMWSENAGWLTIGHYQPKYCPNCGRELKENSKHKKEDPDA